MGDHTWYRNADWDAAAQELFWRKFKRARRSKGWAAAQKSAELWYVGLKHEARSLLSRAEELAPGRLKLDEQRVRFDLDEGEAGPAEAYYRGKGDKMSLALALARSPDPQRRAESRALLSAWHRDDDWDHAPEWEAALEHLGEPASEELGVLAESLAAIHAESRRPDPRLARMDAEVEQALAGRSRRSLEALDSYHAVLAMPGLFQGVIQPNHPGERWRREFLLGSYVPALGAYLGEVLVREGGAWQRARPVLRSAVHCGGRRLDPFRHAFDVVFYHVRCMDLLAG